MSARALLSLADFEPNAVHQDAVRLRHWDDTAKVPGLNVPGLDRYRERLKATRWCMLENGEGIRKDSTFEIDAFLLELFHFPLASLINAIPSCLSLCRDRPWMYIMWPESYCSILMFLRKTGSNP